MAHFLLSVPRPLHVIQSRWSSVALEQDKFPAGMWIAFCKIYHTMVIIIFSISVESTLKGTQNIPSGNEVKV